MFNPALVLANRRASVRTCFLSKLFWGLIRDAEPLGDRSCICNHVMVQRLNLTESWDIAEQFLMLGQDRRLGRAGR